MHKKLELLDRKKRVGTNLMVALQSFKWFLNFGTLLHVVRDKKFNIVQDIDIGIIGEIENIPVQFGNCNILHKVVSDTTGKLLNVALSDPYNKVTIDVFRWIKYNGMYYHTYDTKMEYPKNGILKEYKFKGVPKECFEPRPGRVEMWKKDLKFNQCIMKGGWKCAMPDAPHEGIDFVLPFNYGTCLDYWYPNWHKKDETFGVSRAHEIITTKTCKGIV